MSALATSRGCTSRGGAGGESRLPTDTPLKECLGSVMELPLAASCALSAALPRSVLLRSARRSRRVTPSVGQALRFVVRDATRPPGMNSSTLHDSHRVSGPCAAQELLRGCKHLLPAREISQRAWDSCGGARGLEGESRSRAAANMC